MRVLHHDEVETDGLPDALALGRGLFFAPHWRGSLRTGFPGARHGISGRMCSVLPSKAASSQSFESLGTASLRRAISRAVNPPAPDLSCTNFSSMASASPGLIRAMIASTIPVRGAPVAPSKNRSFHSFARHQ